MANDRPDSHEGPRLEKGIAELLLQVTGILLHARKKAGLSWQELKAILEDVSDNHESAAGIRFIEKEDA